MIIKVSVWSGSCFLNTKCEHEKPDASPLTSTDQRADRRMTPRHLRDPRGAEKRDKRFIVALYSPAFFCFASSASLDFFIFRHN